MVAANNQSYWYTATNRPQSADGPWGDLDYTYDGVGNRLTRILDDGTVTTQTFGYPSLSNLIVDEDTGGVTTRTFTHDAAGNMTQDVRVADTFDYAFNNAGRISQVKINSVVSADYEYNAQNQLVFRSTTVAGGPSGDMHYVYDRAGRLIAEADAATGNTVREYIRLADMPIAVVADVDTASPVIYYVHVDHLNRPVMMTDGLKANVWEAVWLPFGAIHSITGTASNDARFPGQWFQIETGLHYNWHRHYDPTLARYTQPDPLGFVDGPSVFAYALNSPQVHTDPDGRFIPQLVGAAVGVGFELLTNRCASLQDLALAGLTGAFGGGFLKSIFNVAKRARVFRSGSRQFDNFRKRLNSAGLNPRNSELHHAVLRRNGAVRKFLERNFGQNRARGIVNHPLNLKPLPKTTHRRIHGAFKGQPKFGLLRRLWHGTPAWAGNMLGGLGSGAAYLANRSENCECKTNP